MEQLQSTNDDLTKENEDQLQQTKTLSSELEQKNSDITKLTE